MAEAIYWIGGGLTLFGALLTVAGAIGVLRFPDVYSRLHAASITDTGGATVMLIGLGLLGGLSPVTLKLLAVWAFVMITSPTASHALANAAFSAGERPWVGGYRILKGGGKDGKAKTGDGGGAA